jgi:hypothetical protein
MEKEDKKRERADLIRKLSDLNAEQAQFLFSFNIKACWEIRFFSLPNPHATARHKRREVTNP